MSKVIAILYILSVIMWIISFYKVKKSDNKLNGYTSIFISIFALMCYQSLIAFVLKFTFIPLNNLSFTIFNFAFGIWAGYKSIIKKNKQEYYYTISDIIAIIVFSMSVLWVASIQFGNSFTLFNYQCTWDSGVHLQYARDFASEGELPGLYFMALNMGLWLQSVWAFNPYNTGCQLFICADILILILCACLFWQLLCYHMKEKMSYCIGLAFTLLYIFGYPLNNMMFGTSYLGAGNDCVIFVVILVNLFIKDKIYSKCFFPLLICGCIGLLASYSLFVPVVWGSILLYFLGDYYQNGKISRKMIMTLGGIVLFLAAVLVAGFSDRFWEAVSGLTMEGQIYRNLLMNFIFLIPLVMMGIRKMPRKSFPIVMFCMTLGYVFLCMLCVFTGRMSGYYYYKNYYLLWMICFYIAFIVVAENIKKDSYIRSYLVGWALLAVLGISDIGERFDDYNDEVLGYGSVFGESHVSDLFDLYNFNFSSIKKRPVDDGTRELFLEAAKMNETIDGAIYFVGTYQFALQKQFSAIANQPDIYYFDITSPEEYIKRIKDTSEYVCVVDPEYAYWDITEYLSTLEVIYQNDRGYIAKVK